MGAIIDGKAVAKKIIETVKAEVVRLRTEKGIIPKLAAILAGEDPASESYVRGKEKALRDAGIESVLHRFSASDLEESVLSLISKLNEQKSVHGILVQLPLRKGLNTEKILEAILPSKDVDGLHPLNMGKLFKGADPLFTPCTPAGIIELILSTGVDIATKHAVVVGRSNLVGKPTAILLLGKNATVTLCHTKTKDLGRETLRADILVVAAGRPKMITASMVKPHAIVIDVGVNRTETGLVGDVDFEAVKDIASYITPVPGGVGPMTVAMLLKNTLMAAKRATF